MSKKPAAIIAPRSAQLLFEESITADRLAKKYAAASVEALARAWRLVREVHPEKVKVLTYSYVTHEVVVAPEGTKSELRKDG